MPARSPVSLNLRSVCVARGAQPVLVDVDLTVNRRSRIAVVGPNGVGKSTLLHVLAGELPPDSGTRTASPRTARVGLVDQRLDTATGATVRELLADRVGVTSAQVAFDVATRALAAGEHGADDRYTAALDAWTDAGVAEFDARVEAVARDLGLAPDVLQRPPGVLSGGESARVGLAAVLLSTFDVVLLDEPTNDLDLDGLTRLERWIADHHGGVVLVSHDRAFLERTVGSVLELREHEHTAELYEGGWHAYLTERAAARRQAEDRHGAYVAERDRLRRRAQRQREWAAEGASRARTRPRDGDKFGRAHALAQTEKLAGRARATEIALERLEPVDKPWQGWELRLEIAAGDRSGSRVAGLERAVIRRGDLLLGPVDLELRWGERVRLDGPNGAGKTTLIGALLGRVPLESGRAWQGSHVVVGELDQARTTFDRPDTPLLGVFEEHSGLEHTAARTLLAKFGLGSEAVHRPPASLSPGERTRAQLALFQAREVNLLVLDEPTNHLDLPAIEQLESALEDYPGTLVLVSHDRRFADAVRTDRVVGVPGA